MWGAVAPGSEQRVSGVRRLFSNGHSFFVQLVDGSIRGVAAAPVPGPTSRPRAGDPWWNSHNTLALPEKLATASNRRWQNTSYSASARWDLHSVHFPGQSLPPEAQLHFGLPQTTSVRSVCSSPETAVWIDNNGQVWAIGKHHPCSRILLEHRNAQRVFTNGSVFGAVDSHGQLWLWGALLSEYPVCVHHEKIHQVLAHNQNGFVFLSESGEVLEWGGRVSEHEVVVPKKRCRVDDMLNLTKHKKITYANCRDICIFGNFLKKKNFFNKNHSKNNKRIKKKFDNHNITVTEWG